MTYNVHSCVGADRRCDVARVAAVIAHEKPDIVALQELDVGRLRTGGIDQAHQIASRLGMAFYFHPTVQVAEERYGDAILTALPMKVMRCAPLPTLRGMRGLEPRGALWVQVESEGGTLNVVNTHLGLIPLEQRDQMAALLGPDWLGHPDCRDPVLMLGDFNATARYAVYGKATAGRLRDAQRLLQQQQGRGARAIPTFPARFPVLRIDHAFVGPGVEVLDVRVPGGPQARAASDHLPLVVDFKLK
jgi:endonuclease/exonuclease/phosphatase family metal-dependent hydrolase